MTENFLDTLLANCKIEFKDNQIIINLNDEEDIEEKDTTELEDKINNLSDDTFVAICESIGKDKIKEMSDNGNYQEFVNEAIKWVEDKINTLTKELDILKA
ncbi:MAG: hypothetical protein MR996_08600 [Ruminococcus sp.]|nr:hypothetical protein [Ruminococcus sp.]MCI6506398.1 hypothetical protein [Ruminococcus sp.]